MDVAASSGYERDVDVVSIRPADYATDERPWGGFIEFAREFNRQIAGARTRTSPVRAGMQTAGLIPAWAHAAVVRSNPAALDDAFGSLCVTIVREARVFIAPMTDLGLGHGFFAIGSANLPSADGTPRYFGLRQGRSRPDRPLPGDPAAGDCKSRPPSRRRGGLSPLLASAS